MSLNKPAARRVLVIETDSRLVADDLFDTIIGVNTSDLAAAYEPLTWKALFDHCVITKVDTVGDTIINVYVADYTSEHVELVERAATVARANGFTVQL